MSVMRGVFDGLNPTGRVVEDECVDSGANVFVGGKSQCDNATNIQAVSEELGTAQGSVSIDSIGDCVTSQGIHLKGAWLAPWLPMTLISLSQLMATGYTFLAKGTQALLVSPGEEVYRYELSNGLLKPQLPFVDEIDHDMVYFAKQNGGSESSERGKAEPSWGGLAGPPLIFACLALLESVLLGTQMTKDVATLFLPMLAAAKQLVQAGGAWTAPPVMAKKRTRVKQPRDDPVLHARKGHPHDPDCVICKMARKRAPPARQRAEDHVLDEAEMGYHLSLDYAGPFEPDVDGNKYFLAGVEVAHTKYGLVQLTTDRSSQQAVTAVKKMICDLHTAGPDPKPLHRVHTDDDTSFMGEFGEFLTEEKIKQTNTGGHRPTNNAHSEKRIGLLTCCFRALLLGATGGGRYYDQLWGPGIKHANKMVNQNPWSDGISPYSRRVGKDYEWQQTDHVFGAHCLYWTKKEHRESKWQSPGTQAIWVGKSDTTPGAHLVIPYLKDVGSDRYVLGPTVTAPAVDVDDTRFPLLNMGPVSEGSESHLEDFEKFIKDFECQFYATTITEEDKATQIVGEDPLLDVEVIVAKKGKGRKTKFLVKWVGYEKKTWEPLKHLTSCKDKILEYESKRYKTAKLVYDNTYKAYVIQTVSEHARAVAELIPREGVKGSTEDWLPGYAHELEEVSRRRLQKLSEVEARQVPKGTAVRL